MNWFTENIQENKWVQRSWEIQFLKNRSPIIESSFYAIFICITAGIWLWRVRSFNLWFSCISINSFIYHDLIQAYFRFKIEEYVDSMAIKNNYYPEKKTIFGLNFVLEFFLLLHKKRKNFYPILLKYFSA